MLFLILSSLVTFATETDLNTELLQRQDQRLVNQIQNHISPFSESIEQKNSKKSSYQLERADLDFGLSGELGILFFSKGHERAVELIWERKEKKNNSSEVQDIEIVLTGDDDETTKMLLKNIKFHLGEKWANTKLRKKIINTIYKDARKINRYIHVVTSFNGSKNWYVRNYFKNYYFGASGEILVAGVGYDKRLRFRFTTPSVLVNSTPPKSRYQRRVTRELNKLADHFEEVSSVDMPYHIFEMNRVRYLTDYGLDIDLGFMEISKGRGLLLEWVPSEKNAFNKSLFPGMTAESMRVLASFFENNIKEGENFHLGQIRLKGAIEKQLSLFFLSISRSRNIEYHYRRRTL
jgi:hypothetical protein